MGRPRKRPTALSELVVGGGGTGALSGAVWSPGPLTREGNFVTVGLKRHYPARGRVSAGWRPRSGINNAVPSMAGSLEVVRPAHGQEAGAECR